jgi:hypothetical protein
MGWPNCEDDGTKDADLIALTKAGAQVQGCSIRATVDGMTVWVNLNDVLYLSDNGTSVSLCWGYVPYVLTAPGAIVGPTPRMWQPVCATVTAPYSSLLIETLAAVVGCCDCDAAQISLNYVSVIGPPPPPGG